MVGNARDAETRDTWEDVVAHGLWKQGITSIFYIHIVNLDTGSNLCMTPKKSLAEAKKYKKYKHLHSYLDHRRYFTPLVLFSE